METGIHVGNKIDAKEAVGPIAQAVKEVLKAISEYGIDRETAAKALDAVAMAAQPAPTSISYCNIHAGARPQPREVYDDDGDAA